MAQKIPVKYENSAHDIFQPGDTVPPEFLDDTSIIAGPGIKVTRLANGTFVIENLCFPCDDEPCVPNWTNVGSPYCQGDNCVQLQQDGCGNTQTIPSTGCSPACGCVPNWTNVGAPYCIGNSCMQDQVDGCGDTRTVVGYGCSPACGTCTPNYVATSTYECRADGRYYRWYVDANNCGGLNGQWEDVGEVEWDNNGEQVCDGTTNTWHQPEINQCGVTRLRDTEIPCEEPCVPSDWEDVPDAFRCDGNQTQKQQFNGCEYQWVNIGHVWEDTGAFRCIEVEGVCQYQKQERSVHCPSVLRYVSIEPCEWTPVVPHEFQCGPTSYQQRMENQCGDRRWDIIEPIDWTPTGEEQCEGGFIEIEEENQCGDKRWTTTTTPCGEDPEVDWALGMDTCCVISPQGTGHTITASLVLNPSGTAVSSSSCGQLTTGTWLPPGEDPNDYEAQLVGVGGPGNLSPTGPNSWVNLGTLRSWSWSYSVPGTSGNACAVFDLELRRIGGPIQTPGRLAIEFRINSECVGNCN